MQATANPAGMPDFSGRVTAEWLTRALSRNHPGTVVERATIIRVMDGFSAKLWIEMDFNEAGIRAGLPRVMLLKAGFNRHDPIMLFAYEAEMLSYLYVVPHYPINAPKCFYAGPSPDGVSASVIIEDLSGKGTRFCHALEPLTRDEAARFLDAQAKFHASSWNQPSLLDGTAEFAQCSARNCQGLAAYYQQLVAPEAWAKYIALPRGAAIPRMLHDRERCIEAMSRLAAFGKTQAQVILMGDEHLGNLYIEKDGTPGFYDFQGLIEAWCRGIAYFLCCALDIQDRRRWERELVGYYLDRLRAYGVAAPSFDAGWDAYCRYLIFPYFVFLTNGTEFQSESVNTANAARGAAAVIDNDSFGRLGL